MTVGYDSGLPRVGESRIKWLRRTIVASSSFLALSATMKLDAGPIQTCGLPAGGIVNCGDTDYPSGISYDAIDDLTVNVGAPAGQNGAVTVDDTIVVNDMWHAPDEQESLRVGRNVAIRALSFGESMSVYSATLHVKAVSMADILNDAVIVTSGDGAAGIRALASTLTAAYASADGVHVGTSFASASIENTGLIVTSGDYAPGLHALTKALESYQGSYVATMTALSQVHNAGDLTTVGYGSNAIFAESFISSYGDHFYAGRYNHTATVVGSADEADLSIFNTGRLLTLGIGANGINATIDARGYSDTILASETVISNGAIDTTGADADGIKAMLQVEGNGLNSTMATAQIDITNSGAITTRGDHAGGIVVTTDVTAGTRGAAAIASATFVVNSGPIATFGDDAEGIAIQTDVESKKPVASSVSATGQVTNTGGITTSGEAAKAIDVSQTVLGTGAKLYAGGIVANSGALATAGEQADAIAVTASSQGFAKELDAIINTYNAATLSTSGGKSRGLDLSALTIDTGDTVLQTARITAKNSGAIATSGDIADAIKAYARSDGIDGTAGATTSIDNSGNLATAGRSASGIYTIATATISGSDRAGLQAQSSVTNIANITTLGDYAYGIGEVVTAGSRTSGTGAAATLQASIAASNSGTIVTSGGHAHGITIFAVTGGDIGSQTVTVAADNSGTIATSGDDARGIWADMNVGDNSVVMNAQTRVTNSGQIKTAGAGSDGILASTWAYGEGVDSSHLSSDTQITNFGQIATSGDGSMAIQANARLFDGGSASAAGLNNQGTLALTITNAGTLLTTGAYAAAINTAATATSYGTNTVHFDAMTSINNSGAISTSGASSSGISATTTLSLNNSKPQVNAGIVIANTGTISVSGDLADGIAATISVRGLPSAGTSSNTLTPDMAVIASILPIEPDGPGSGYDVSSPIISGDISNSGSINVSGRYGAGIAVTTLTSGTLGSACNPGIYVCEMAAYIASMARVENSGLVRASGYGGIGVVANADTVLIDNLVGGTITGGSGLSVAAVVAQGTDITVTNAGMINSVNDHALALIGKDNVTVTNYAGGKIMGYITLSSPSTTFENDGTWTARGGNSDFTPTTGGSSIIVNRGTVLVVGNQVFKGLSEFDNAGLLSLSATNAALGTRPAFEKLEITGDFAGLSGSKLEVGSNMTTMADQLKIDGAVSGTTTVMIDKQGAPGLTTGSGIPIVDVSSGTTSAGNFKLAGNSTAGTLIDGAYEYALGPVPESAGHGTWYLSSHVYPGAYQIGQIGSSALILSQQADDWFGNVLLNWGEGGGTLRASAAPPVRVASNDASFTPAASATGGYGVWGGVDGASLGVSPSGPAFGDYRLHSTIGHVGLDTMFEGNYGTAVLGLTINPIDASALFHNFASTRMKMTGYTWSGYAFWAGGSWRAGLQVGTGRVNTHFTDSYVGTDAKVAMNTFSIQGAAAYTGRLDEDIWYEPSAVMGYTTLDSGSFTNGVGDTVSFGDTGSVFARLGLRIGRTYELGWGSLKPHVDVAVRYEAEGTTSVDIGNFAYSSGVGGASGQVGAGATLELGKGIRLFADALYSGGAKVSGWQGSVGLRLTP